MWNPKIVTILLGGAGCLFWDGEDVYFAFVDVALNLQCLFPMMSFATYKFYLSSGQTLLLNEFSVHVPVKGGKKPTNWSCVVLCCNTFL